MAAEPDTLPSNLTIGAVCRMLGEEFDDISISKIRFLEDQKLIAPRRTQGGYRLFSLDDVERLRAILRMQRDEFLPLAVIRDMLTQGVSRPTGTRRRRDRRRPALHPGAGGVRAAGGAAHRPAQALHAHGRRDRRALPAAGPLRRRSSPSEGVPLGRGTRGGS